MAIDYAIQGDRQYGTVVRVYRDAEGKVCKDPVEYLGRVLDKDKLIFRNKTDGIFRYNLLTHKKEAVQETVPVPKRKSRKKIPARPIIYRFADVYLLDRMMKSLDLYSLFEGAFDDQEDTLKAMICFYLLSPLANMYAADWYEQSFAKFLFPKAHMQSQRISEFLEYIGEPSREQTFFHNYLKWFSKTFSSHDLGNILVDSTGLPNSVHFNLTAISNHNGIIENEARLVYVVQQTTGLPIFMRCIAGNIIDVSTIKRTILELKALGVDVHYAITDAGYYSDENIESFYAEKISFILRLKPNRIVYKQILQNHLRSIKEKGTLVRQNKRIVRVMRVPCKLAEKLNPKGQVIENGFDAYAYLCVDEQRKALEKLQLIDKAVNNQDVLDRFDEQDENAGVFVLVSKRPIAPEKIVEIYYMRQQIEQVFDFGKNYANMLPLSIQKEQTFRGHMLLTFIATVLIKILSVKLAKENLPPIKVVFEELKNNYCKLVEKQFITTEPNKVCNNTFKAAGIQFPVSVSID